MPGTESVELKPDELSAPDDLNLEQDGSMEDIEDESSTPDDNDGNSATEVDYTAELERLEERNKQLEKGLKNERWKQKRRAEKEPEQSGDSDGDDTGALEDRVARRVESQLAAHQERWEQQRERETIGELLGEVSGNDSEKKLIKHHYENSIKHTGFTRQAILDDMRTAQLLANRKRYISENEELKKALISKSTMETSPSISGSGKQVKKSSIPGTLTSKDQKMIKAFGLTDKDFKRSLTN